MATKKVQNVLIDLKIQGAEKLAALKGSFRDLGKTIGQTDVDIDAARKSVIEYGKTANQSEAVVKGQIKAFEGLREQAQMGGKVYRELSNDIATLKSQLNGSTPAIDAQRKALIESANSAKVTRSQLIGLLSTLSALQKQTAAGSKAFAEIGDDIANLESKIIKVKAAQEDLNRVTLAGNQAAAGGAAATRLQIKAIDQKVASLREEKQQLESLKRQEKARLGFQTILERPGDVPFRTREYIEGAVAEAALGGNITKQFGQKEVETAINAVKQSVIELQNEIEIELARGARRTFQEMARDGRESARSLAQAFSGPEFERIFSNLDKNVGELPNTTAGLSQRLRELERVLNNTARGGDNYVAVALEIARVQREASAATQGLGAALIKDLASGAAVRNQKNLREVIGQLQAEMSELNTKTAEGSAKYAENARQVNNLQKELDQISNSYRTVTDVARQAGMAMGGSLNPFTVAGGRRRATPDFAAYEQPIGPEISPAAKQAAEDRKQEIRDRIANLRKINAENDALREQNAIRRSIAKNRARLAARAGIEPPVREISGLYQGIADIGMSKIAADIDRMGNSYYQVAGDIRNATKASNGSINSLQAQRNAWATLRAGLDPTSEAYRQVGIEIDKVERRLDRLNKRRRMSPMQITQAAGAAISGGIFGGPEGFVGGAAGALVGGVGGAFAGAAIGAQVGGIRRTLGEYADYAAQITRLNIALEGITGSQAQYNRALQAAADVTAQLNVPQEVAVQGMTRLVAAVKGAGGGVAEAEVAFKNINAAIIATGGGAEQVQGAVTALVQIFSKGKVSAEEINQIAERLPGTFNKIAAASGRTGPELTKALQQGTVGLNDLMKFLVSLGDEYGELAEKIASSQENAGARLQVAFNQLRIEVGNALKPVGAEFQNAFAEFIKDITPTLVAVLPKIGELVLVLANNLDVLAAAAAGAATAMGLLAIASAKVAIPAGVAGLGVLMLKTAAAAGTLSAALKGVALLNPFVLLGAGLAAATVGIVKYYNNQKELNELLDEGKGSTEAIKNKIQEYEDSITKATSKLKGINGEKKATGREASRLKKEVAELRGELQRLQGTYKIRLEYERKGYKFGDKGEMTEFTVGNIVYGGPKGARAKALRNVDGTPIGQNLKGFDDPVLDKNGPGSGKKRESRAPQLAQELIYLTSAAQIKEKIRAAELDGNKMLQIRLEGEMRLMEFAKQSALIDLEKIPADEKQLKQAKILQEAEQARLDIVQNLALEGKRALEQIEAPLKDLVKEYEKEARTRERINELIKQGVDEGLAQEFVKIEEIIEVQRKLLNERIAYAEASLIAKGIDEEIRKELEKQLEILKKQKKELPKKEEEAKDAAKELNKEETFMEGLGKAIGDQEKALEKLINPINQVKEAANAIGEAFKTSFKGIITGSMTAREALASFFQSIADHFADMAAQIAAEAIKLAALKFVQMIVSSFAGAAGGNTIDVDAVGAYMPGGSSFAQGGYVPGGFKAFNQGGVVSQPTLGMVGEGGEPEYIIPQSKMRESMARYSRGVRGPGVIPDSTGASATDGGGTAVAAPIDVRYTVERINSVDYVTADQFQRGMQQAAAQGATQGEQRALTTLRQNTSQRRRIGL